MAIPALDSLRGLAALSVVLFHSWWGTPWMMATPGMAESHAINYARTGVHLFFVLSGFLLFLPYARWVDGGGRRPDARLFYQRRLLRIGPAYWLCVAILVLISSPIYMNPRGVLDTTLHVLFLSNVRASSAYTINGVFWTMAVEMQFYALLPIIGILFATSARRIRLPVAVGLLYAGLLSVSLGVGWLEHHGHVVSPFLVGETSLPHWIEIFGDGILAAVLVVALERRGRQVGLGTGTSLFICGLLLAISLICIPSLHALPIKGVLFGWSYTALLLGTIWGAPIISLLLSVRWLRSIGLISYSLYLWHSKVAEVVVGHMGAGDPMERTLVAFALTLSVALPLAYLSFQLVERPFLSIRGRRRAGMASGYGSTAGASVWVEPLPVSS